MHLGLGPSEKLGVFVVAVMKASCSRSTGFLRLCSKSSSCRYSIQRSVKAIVCWSAVLDPKAAILGIHVGGQMITSCNCYLLSPNKSSIVGRSAGPLLPCTCLARVQEFSSISTNWEAGASSRLVGPVHTGLRQQAIVHGTDTASMIGNRGHSCRWSEVTSSSSSLGLRVYILDEGWSQPRPLQGQS